MCSVVWYGIALLGRITIAGSSYVLPLSFYFLNHQTPSLLTRRNGKKKFKLLSEIGC